MTDGASPGQGSICLTFDFDLTMHPQVIGWGHRIKLLEQVIEHGQQYPGLRFARMGEVAEEFRARSGGPGGQRH